MTSSFIYIATPVILMAFSTIEKTNTVPIPLIIVVGITIAINNPQNGTGNPVITSAESKNVVPLIKVPSAPIKATIKI